MRACRSGGRRCRAQSADGVAGGLAAAREARVFEAGSPGGGDGAAPAEKDRRARAPGDEGFRDHRGVNPSAPIRVVIFMRFPLKQPRFWSLPPH